MDIASGPTVPDASTCDDALAIARRHGIALPDAASAWLASPTAESPKPGDARRARAEARIVAALQASLEAAASVAQTTSYAAHIPGDAFDGEARDVGCMLAGIALQVARRGQPFTAPCVLLSGGETTVTVRGTGRGGRNVEALLSCALAQGDDPRIHALMADTDGVDSLEEIAGAFATPDTLARARALGINPRERLDANDGHGFFGALCDALVTGPTRTDVNHFRTVVVGA